MTYRSKKQRSWVRRTIRDGKVKIYGRWYALSNQYREYDGRFDSRRGLFYVYPNETKFIGLWGICEDHKDNRDLCIMEDGTIPWAFWRLIDNT